MSLRLQTAAGHWNNAAMTPLYLSEVILVLADQQIG